jgi:hypothetical protein
VLKRENAKKSKEILLKIAGSDNASAQNLLEVAHAAANLENAKNAKEVFAEVLKKDHANKSKEILLVIAGSDQASAQNLKDVFNAAKGLSDLTERAAIFQTLYRNKEFKNKITIQIALNLNKLKLIASILSVVIGGAIVFSLSGLSMPAIFMGIGLLGFQLLIQLAGYGLDELFPSNKWVKLLISPVLQLSFSIGLMYVTMFIPVISPSMWLTMIPVGLSYLVKMTIQAIATNYALEVDTQPQKTRALIAVLPILITAIGIGAVVALSSEIMMSMFIWQALALAGCCIGIQVITYALNVIPNTYLRILSQVIISGILSSALIVLFIPIMPITLPLVAVIATLTSSVLMSITLNCSIPDAILDLEKSEELKDKSDMVVDQLDNKVEQANQNNRLLNPK